jgi:hypothetical protein
MGSDVSTTFHATQQHAALKSSKLVEPRNQKKEMLI